MLIMLIVHNEQIYWCNHKVIALDIIFHSSKRQISRNNNHELYLMVIPGIVLLLIFRYIPLGGLILAFEDYNIFKGFINSEWVGLKHFNDLFNSPDFYKIFKNTIVISFQKLLFGFPAPIIMAIFLNEVRRVKVKRFAQNIFYLPHFLSWVMIAGLAFEVFSLKGPVNNLISLFGIQPIMFLGNSDYFVSTLVISDIWKNVGWGSIIYLAALASIDTKLYEAAIIDGASRFKQIIYITIPSLVPTIVVLFIVSVSKIMDAGQDQILMMYNPLVMSVADIIDTYVYRIGLGEAKYSFTTAVGMFKSVVAMILVLGSNKMIRKISGGGIW